MEVQILVIFSMSINYFENCCKPNWIFLSPSTTQNFSPTLQPVSEYGSAPKPAQLRGEGWEVSEGRGGGMTGT